MASKREVVVTLTDDLDGGKAAEAVPFGLDGANYEIDLSAKNARALRADVTKWTEHARKAGRTSRRGRGTGPKPVSEAAAIREWAGANGIEVPARGRIPAAVAERYHAD